MTDRAEIVGTWLCEWDERLQRAIYRGQVVRRWDGQFVERLRVCACPDGHDEREAANLCGQALAPAVRSGA